MSTADIRLPEKWSKGSSGGPEWLTHIVEKASGDEHRNQRWGRPRWRYDIAHNVKSPEDISDLRAFHLARRGRRIPFLLKDWIDWTSADDGVSAPTATDQPLGTGDGVTDEFQLIKRYGDAAGHFDRPILWPVAGSVLVAVDGTPLAPSAFDVDRGTGIVAFDSAPSDTAVLTAGFAFDVPVRFDDDWLSISWDTINSRSAGQVPLIEVRS